MTLALAGSSPAIPATPEQSMLCPGSFYAQSVVVSVVFRFFRKFINDPLAQLAEQLPFKQWVRGSNPRRVTRKTSNPQWGSDVFLIGSAGDPNGSIAAVRWTAASASANAGGSLCFAGGKTQTNPRRVTKLGLESDPFEAACFDGTKGERPESAPRPLCCVLSLFHMQFRPQPLLKDLGEIDTGFFRQVAQP